MELEHSAQCPGKGSYCWYESLGLVTSLLGERPDLRERERERESKREQALL